MLVTPDWPDTLPCKIAFVAEAPGADEAEQGRVLVGATGKKVFNPVLRVAEIERADCLVTNVFDKRPPNNNIDAWCKSGAEKKEWPDYSFPPIADRLYLCPEYLEALERLDEEITKADPNIIVPMGGKALWAFTGHYNIAVRRGFLTTATLVGAGRKILPTWHPAYVLRNFNAFAQMARDLIKAKAQSHTKHLVMPPRWGYLNPTTADLEEWLPRFLGAKMVSIDIETMFGQIDMVGFSRSWNEAFVVPFVDWSNNNRSYWMTVEDEIKALEFVKTIMEAPVEKVFQNGPFDMQWMFEEWGIVPKNALHDTRLLHHSIWPELPKGLGDMGSNYARPIPAWKAQHKHKEKRDE